mmetsp:Transcript_11379/g.30654  ORF Transcript_11379/g.30654 Transcript_11379/m.30654 type:complete len:148 (-) Transcript_11379:456-899(-)
MPMRHECAQNTVVCVRVAIATRTATAVHSAWFVVFGYEVTHLKIHMIVMYVRNFSIATAVRASVLMTVIAPVVVIRTKCVVVMVEVIAVVGVLLMMMIVMLALRAVSFMLDPGAAVRIIHPQRAAVLCGSGIAFCGLGRFIALMSIV